MKFRCSEAIFKRYIQNHANFVVKYASVASLADNQSGSDIDINATDEAVIPNAPENQFDYDDYTERFVEIKNTVIPALLILF